jgi:hypothetical protein
VKQALSITGHASTEGAKKMEQKIRKEMIRVALAKIQLHLNRQPPAFGFAVSVIDALEREWEGDFDRPVDLLPLSASTIASLTNAGFVTVEQLKRVPVEDLVFIKGISGIRAAEIRQVLEIHYAENEED